MNHFMNKKKLYQSQLRQEQMKRTRELILEGLIKTMASGIAELSIPAVAHEAGVSIPTVYRYFRTKRDLIEALGGYCWCAASFTCVFACVSVRMAHVTVSAASSPERSR